jgi:rhomboid protease GluP
VVTILLIAFNIIIYLLMVFSGVNFFDPTAADALAWGGCNSTTILHGEPWRLVSAMFIHFGIFHLLMNLYALYDLGSTLERIIGKARFITVYLATGVFGGLVSQIWHVEIYTVEAGASGGVFGIIGVLIALLTTKLFPDEVRVPYLKRVLTMVAINIAYGMQGNINMAAHMGGMISGFILGYAVYLTMVHEKRKLAVLCCIPLLTWVCMTGTLKHMRGSDSVKFDEIISQFEALQERGENALTSVDETNMTYYLRKVLIPEWQKRTFLIEQIRNLKLSGNKEKYRDYMLKWVDLTSRKFQVVELQISAIERNEDDSMYHKMIQSLDDQIAKLKIESGVS